MCARSPHRHPRCSWKQGQKAALSKSKSSAPQQTFCSAWASALEGEVAWDFLGRLVLEGVLGKDSCTALGGECLRQNAERSCGSCSSWLRGTALRVQEITACTAAEYPSREHSGLSCILLPGRALAPFGSSGSKCWLASTAYLGKQSTLGEVWDVLCEQLFVCQPQQGQVLQAETALAILKPARGFCQKIKQHFSPSPSTKGRKVTRESLCKQKWCSPFCGKASGATGSCMWTQT